MNSGNVAISRTLLRWYDTNRRDLPWRAAVGSGPDPYQVLVSEAMLQQTQVRTVIPYFNRFIQKLPTIKHLARADEQTVLRLWQGLGYYSRARNLRRAAQDIVQKYDGKVPADVDALLELPGIGRYTAGAIASLAYDVPAPIVDGNVTRVLCRLDAIQSPPADRATQKLLWERAAALVPSCRAGDFNSALMELGATVCTARTPQCPKCPLRRHCRAHEMKIQDQIPAPRPARPIPLVVRRTWCIRRGVNGRTVWLIEQRPQRGRWAGLWQFVTTEEDQPKLGLRKPIATIEHTLSHRHYRFLVFVCEGGSNYRSLEQGGVRRWVRLDELRQYPLPRPHLRIAAVLRDL